MNFDQVLAEVDGFGRYQKMLYVLICLPQIFLAFHMMASIFTGYTPPHQCRSSDTEHFNVSVNYSDSCSITSSAQNRTEDRCPHGWLYSREIIHNSTVTEVKQHTQWSVIYKGKGSDSPLRLNSLVFKQTERSAIIL